MSIDLNSDLGEGFGSYSIGGDEAILPHITSANLACGFHAGDPEVMRRTVRLCKEHGVAVGAHPGFPDLMGFGRRTMATFPGQIREYVLYQVAALAGFCKAEGVPLQHVKPHGALYNTLAMDEAKALEVVEAIKEFDDSLILVLLAGSISAQAARAAGLRVAEEAFADRAYQADGQLVPRGTEGAVLHDEGYIISRIVGLAQKGTMPIASGGEIEMQAKTLCLHGDTQGAADLAGAIRAALEENGQAPRPMSELV